MDHDPELMIHEDPPGLRIEDREAFCGKMRAAAARFPDSQSMHFTLQSSERMPRERRDEWAAIAAKSA